MNDTVDHQGCIDQLAILACEFSGLKPFHVKDGQPLYKSEEAQTRAKLAYDLMAGAGRPTIMG